MVILFRVINGYATAFGHKYFKMLTKRSKQKIVVVDIFLSNFTDVLNNIKKRTMNIDKIAAEIEINGSRKINIGVRAYPELKNKLSEEASGLGITLSEYCENILLNKELIPNEKKYSMQEVETLRGKVSKLNSLLADGVNQHKDEMENRKKLIAENEKLNIENTDLKTKMGLKDGLLALYSDKRLLDLFGQLKGQKVSINTSEGQKHFTYNQPKDLLEVMIYSFKLKKP